MPTKNFFNRIVPMIFLDPDDGAGGGGEPKSEPPKEPTEEEKQKMLDKQFAERAERGKQAGRAEVLKELGIDDPEEAKKLLEAARKAQDAQKSELERAESARQKAEKDAEDARLAADTALKTATTRILNSEIKIAASAPVTDKDGKVTRPSFRKEALDDVLLLINRDGIQEKDGTFDGIEKSLADLAKAKPYLLVEPQPKPGGGTPLERGSSRKPIKGQEGDRKPIIGSL